MQRPQNHSDPPKPNGNHKCGHCITSRHSIASNRPQTFNLSYFFLCWPCEQVSMQRPQNYGGVPKQLMGLCRKKFKEIFLITTNLLFPMTKNQKKNFFKGGICRSIWQFNGKKIITVFSFHRNLCSLNANFVVKTGIFKKVLGWNLFIFLFCSIMKRVLKRGGIRPQSFLFRQLSSPR